MNRRQAMKLLGIGGAAAVSVLGTRDALAGNRYYQGPVSDHFDGTRFFNPGGKPQPSFRDVLRWQLGGGRTAWSSEGRQPERTGGPGCEGG
jgi:hypothetical protein